MDDDPSMDRFDRPAIAFVGPHKSVGLAVLLSLLFGPLGMFYSTIGGALVMTFFGGLFTVVTLGAGVIFVIPVCMIWAGSAASSHNYQRELQTAAHFLLAR